MRKLTLFLSIILLLNFQTLVGAPEPSSDLRAAIAPRNGGFGINMASQEFQGGYEWWNYDNGATFDSHDYYGYRQMIAIGGVYNMRSE